MVYFRPKKNIPQSSDEELLQYIQSGTEEAFNELYARYARKIHFYFYRLLNGDKEKADDFLQDLFMKIIEKPEAFNPQMKFSSWLYTVANNMCRNEYRKASVRGLNIDLSATENSLKEADLATISNYDRVQFNKKVQSLLSTLNPDHQITFTLRFQEQMSIKEIGEIMQCSEGTVKSRIFYTLKKMTTSLVAFENIY